MTTMNGTYDVLASEVSEVAALQQRVAALEQQLQAAQNERQQMAEELQRLNEELQQQVSTAHVFQMLVEHAQDGIALADETGVFTYTNGAYRTMLGYETSLVGTPLAQVIYPEEHQWIPEIVAQVTSEGFWKGELTYCRQDGVPIPCQITVFPIAATNGEAMFTAAIVRDMSQVKRGEHERAALQEQMIEVQRAALRELSTPLIPISDEVVIMPLIGSIDTQRAQQMMEMLLTGIAQHQADIAILDITGVQVVDTQVANAFIRAAQAVKLLGAQIILTGIQPAIAQTLVHLGVEMRGIVTRSTLQAGIGYALAQTRSR